MSNNERNGRAILVRNEFHNREVVTQRYRALSDTAVLVAPHVRRKLCPVRGCMCQLGHVVRSTDDRVLAGATVDGTM